jgi:hypothetical protein
MRIQSSGGREGQRGARATTGSQGVAICEVEVGIEGRAVGLLRVEVRDKRPMTPGLKVSWELLCKRAA